MLMKNTPSSVPILVDTKENYSINYIQNSNGRKITPLTIYKILMALNKFRKVYASSDSHILPHILLQNHGRSCKSGGMRLCPRWLPTF